MSDESSEELVGAVEGATEALGRIENVLSQINDRLREICNTLKNQ